MRKNMMMPRPRGLYATKIPWTLMTNYIYLLQEREFIKTKENVYKVGMTKKENHERFNQYPKGSVLLCQIICNDCNNMEKTVLKKFKETFKQRKDIGNEYFEGDYKNMIDIIYLTIKDEKETINKEEIINDEEETITKDNLAEYLSANWKIIPDEEYDDKKHKILQTTLRTEYKNWLKVNHKPADMTNDKKFTRLFKNKYGIPSKQSNHKNYYTHLERVEVEEEEVEEEEVEEEEVEEEEVEESVDEHKLLISKSYKSTCDLVNKHLASKLYKSKLFPWYCNCCEVPVACKDKNAKSYHLHRFSKRKLKLEMPPTIPPKNDFTQEFRTICKAKID
jgi:hypothetical protein